MRLTGFSNVRRQLFTLLAGAPLLALLATGHAAHAQAPTGSAGQSASKPAAGGEWLVYVGTYTTGNSTSKGIYTMRLDRQSGQLSAPELAVESTSPSFLALHPNKKLLYAVNEVGEHNGAPGGGVTAFTIGARGALTKLNDQNSGGRGPAYISLDRKGTHAFVANYGGGTVAALPIDKDGRLKPASSVVQHEGVGGDPQRQKGPHAHSILPDPSGRFVLSADLGIDKVLVYRFDAAKGTLTPNNPPSAALAAGSGPRHLAFHPNGKFAYVINELKSTLTVFSWDASKGVLTEVQTLSTLPADFTGKSFTAEVLVHPSGKFVYGSNRGHDSISVFTVDTSTGKVTLTSHTPTGGSWPRNFNLDPSGTFLLTANQRSDSIVVFKIDQKTGQLTETGGKAQIAQPAVIKFADPR